VLSADDLVHEAYRDPGLVEEVRARFGDAAVRPDGTIDRAALGRLAFADAGATRDLERLVHPGVAAARDRWVAAQRARVPPPPLLVCEVPLLYEAGLEDRFDAVLVVTAPEEVRRERVARRGQDFSARSARQVSEEVKVARADRYVVNDGTPSDLEAWVAARFAEYAL